MENCLFCKIINGEIPSRTIYEDEMVKVFMDINPSTNGHLLVVPKKHIVNILDMDKETYIYMFNLIKEKIYPLLKEKLNCEGLTIAQNNELGQEVKHFHIHLIPRYQNDCGDFKYDKSLLIDLDEVEKKLAN